MKKLILVGYMGVGKTTIGKLLSKKTNIPFIDLDNLIEENEKLAIKKIFETKGELYFRKTEHQLFKELIENDKQIIIATGGGTPCYYNNHEFLKLENVKSIYLKASIETIYERLGSENEKRPLIANQNESEMKEFIPKHLFERSFYYSQAKFKIDVDKKTEDEIVNEILAILATHCQSKP